LRDGRARSSVIERKPGGGDAYVRDLDSAASSVMCGHELATSGTRAFRAMIGSFTICRWMYSAESTHPAGMVGRNVRELVGFVDVQRDDSITMNLLIFGRPTSAPHGLPDGSSAGTRYDGSMTSEIHVTSDT
jgi:hypothetical protein